MEKNYQGDIAALHALGFDAAKFDNCGSMKNLTKYAELMQATGKNYTVEACHWGHCWDQDGDPDASVSPTIVPAETRSDPRGDDGADAWSVLLRSRQQRPMLVIAETRLLRSPAATPVPAEVWAASLPAAQQESCGQGCPTAQWCPFNLYRTSGDVARVAQSWLHNLQTTTKFRDPDAPLSVPGCWAYPVRRRTIAVVAPVQRASAEVTAALLLSSCVSAIRSMPYPFKRSAYYFVMMVA